MLSREVMGALALAILWVNTLLVAAATLKTVATVGALLRGFGPIAKGQVAGGEGPSGAIAALDIEQVGRLGVDAEPVIVFHDRSHTGRVFGGVVVVDGGHQKILAATDGAEVWTLAEPTPVEPDAGTTFDVASGEARKARGYTRIVRAEIATGDEVWVAASTSSDGGAARGAFISRIEPRAWIAKRAGLAYAFVMAEIAIAGACTAAALSTPHFGPVSTAGAGAGLAFFLLVQPAGTWVNQMLRPPSRALRRDTWRRTPPALVEARR